MPSISRRRVLLTIAVVVALVALAGRVLLHRSAGTGAAQTGGQTFSSLTRVSSAATTDAPAEVVVHVAGAVRRPGLYRLENGGRVADAIRRAGGARRKADLDAVNLAAKLADGEQVLVPVRGAGPSQASSAGTEPSGPVHLNSATLDQLDSLPGVGPVTAQRIIDFRTQHGGFRSVDELDQVPGIGPSRMEQLRELVTL